MNDDPIIEEIHRVREVIAERFDNDLHAICEEARRKQAASGEKTVTLPPRRIESPGAAPTKKAG